MKDKSKREFIVEFAIKGSSTRMGMMVDARDEQDAKQVVRDHWQRSGYKLNCIYDVRLAFQDEIQADQEQTALLLSALFDLAEQVSIEQSYWRQK